MSNKRRKLKAPLESPQLSAFAAKRLRLEKTKELPSVSKVLDSAIRTNGPNGEDGSSIGPSGKIGLKGNAPVADDEVTTRELDIERKASLFEEEEELSTREFISRDPSPEQLPDRPAISLSTWRPTKDNVRGLKDGSLSLKLALGERLVILGQYKISVQKGQISLLGYTIRASETAYPVFAASSHALPVIRCSSTDVDEAVICLSQYNSGLELLKPLSPLFGKLWNDSGPLGAEYSSLLPPSNVERTFQILLTTKDVPKKAFVQPLISAPEWNEMLSRFPPPDSQKAPIVLLCGPKSSGKSTFAKLLGNRILSATAETQSVRSTRPSGIAFLDLDPGQPEYSTPGQLSLIYVEEPNFGPPFSHPIPRGKNRVIRAHSIGALSPASNPSLYISCVLDLFEQFRGFSTLFPNCPLIINTPGWILGTGLDILAELIRNLKPTDIIYMSKEGPSEVVQRLQEAAGAAPLHTLTSQMSEFNTRTAAQLRAMQFMSYFHLDLQDKEKTWHGQALTAVPPWEILYFGEADGIHGIISYGEQPPADLLVDAINGSVLSLVVIDDMKAIPGWGMHDETNDNGDMQSVPPNRQSYIEDVELHAFEDDSTLFQPLQRPLITYIPHEDIPYFNPANTITLNPKHSHTIGTVLIRGIDIRRRRLQILTSIAPNLIDEVIEANKPMVLISGKLDTPGWAYTEELHLKASLEKVAGGKEAPGVDTDEEQQDGGEGPSSYEAPLESGLQDVPWMERLSGSEGRGASGKVWRVRRDLGKSSQ